VADVQIPREAVDKAARAMVRATYAGDDTQWDKLQPTQQHIVRERAMAVLNAAAPLIEADVLDRVRADVDRLAAERDAIGDDDYEPDEDDGDCCADAGECHRSGAMASYARIGSLLTNRITDLRASE
jgi:hypothetical protein